jgi:predicted ATPase
MPGAWFSPQAMLARLDRRLDLLKTTSCDRPVRHQSLRHTVSWSYDLLKAGEQAMFRRLSVFVGGCSLNDAVMLLDAAHDEPLTRSRNARRSWTTA